MIISAMMFFLGTGYVNWPIIIDGYIAKPTTFACENVDGNGVEDNFIRFVTLYSCLFYKSVSTAGEKGRMNTSCFSQESPFLHCERSISLKRQYETFNFQVSRVIQSE